MSAQIVVCNYNLNITGTEAPAGLVSSQPYAQNISFAQNMQNGTGTTLQVDQLYVGSFSLASTTQTLNFNTGLTGIFGESLAFARLRLFCVQITSTTLNLGLKVEAGASNGVTWLGASAAPNMAWSGGGGLVLVDPGSTGATNGLYVSASHCNVTFDSGSSTIAFLVFAAGNTAS